MKIFIDFLQSITFFTMIFYNSPSAQKEKRDKQPRFVFLATVKIAFFVGFNRF